MQKTVFHSNSPFSSYYRFLLSNQYSTRLDCGDVPEPHNNVGYWLKFYKNNDPHESCYYEWRGTGYPTHNNCVPDDYTPDTVTLVASSDDDGDPSNKVLGYKTF